MNSSIYSLVGETMSRVRPGFSTPVFQNRNSNGLFVQNFGENETISNFIEIQRSYNPFISFSFSNKTREVGQHAYYVYHDSLGTTHVGTRANLAESLLFEFEKLKQRPYLRKTLARFVGDNGQLQLATTDVERLGSEENYKNERVLREYFPEAFEHASYDIFKDFPYYPINNDTIKFLKKTLKSSGPVFLAGRRGTGKTFALKYLSWEISKNSKAPLFINCHHFRSPTNRLLKGRSKESLVDIIAMAMSRDETVSAINFGRKYFDVQEINALKINYQPVILLDGFHAEMLDLDAFIDTVRRLNGDGIKMVVAINDFDLLKLKQLSPLMNESIYHLSNMTTYEAKALVDSLTDILPSIILNNLDKEVVSREITGLSYREGIYVLNEIVRNGYKPNHTRNTIFQKFDLDLKFEHSINQSGMLDMIYAGLDQIAESYENEGLPLRSINLVNRNDRYQFPSGAVTNTLRREIMNLTLIGILSHKGSRVNFSSRLAKDWWVDRRRNYQST